MTALAAGALFGAALLLKLDTLIYLPLAGMILWLGHRTGIPADSEAAAEGRTGGPSMRPKVGRAVVRSPAPGAVRTPRSTGGGGVGGAGREWVRGVLARRSSPKGRGRLSQLLPFVIFVAGLAVSFVALDYLIDGGAFLQHFQQTWISHFAPAKSFEYGSAAEHPFEPGILLRNWDATIPAVLGLLILLPARKRGLAILPVAWLGLMLAVFALHRPWWPYYYVHVAVPLCWCAALGLERVWQRACARRSRVVWALLAVYVLCVLAWMTGRVYLQVRGLRQSPQTYSSLVLGEIARFKPFAEWLFTDEPIYSFHAGLPMPPPLAVVPLKRLWSGDMTNARIAEELRRFKPGVILLRNDAREKPFQALLNSEYRLVYVDGEHLLYAHKAIAKRGNS